MHIDDKILNKLPKHGYELEYYIGSGIMGNAYKIKNKDRVLKITSDESEANAMNVIKNHYHPNVVEVFRVFEFKSINSLWFIEEELLEPINKNLVNKYLYTYFYINEKLEFLRNILILISDDKNMSIYNKFKDIVKNKLYKDENFKITKFDKDFYSFCRGMLDAAKHISDSGIKFYDWHAGNILKRNEYVLIDLGVSKADNQNLEVIDENKIKLKEALEII